MKIKFYKDDELGIGSCICPKCEFDACLTNQISYVDIDGYKLRFQCNECEATFLSEKKVFGLAEFDAYENKNMLKKLSKLNFDYCNNNQNTLRLPWTFKKAKKTGEANFIIDCTGGNVIGFNMNIEWCELSIKQMEELVKLVNSKK